MRPTLYACIHLVRVPVMEPCLPDDILATGSGGSVGVILRDNSTLFLGPHRQAGPQVGSFRNHDGLLRHPGDPVRREGRETRFALKVDA
jgi:hypothetical protein